MHRLHAEPPVPGPALLHPPRLSLADDLAPGRAHRGVVGAPARMHPPVRVAEQRLAEIALDRHALRSRPERVSLDPPVLSPDISGHQWSVRSLSISSAI